MEYPLSKEVKISMIQIEKLSKSFGAKQVLKDISWTLEGGKVYGIVGENGAGKTTLFRCMATLEDYEGLIRSEHEVLKDHLGFLPTQSYFFPKITGWE
ncbi:MAG: ATP-binding cassette domain-containing protein, partial [Bacteroidota bacterium]